MIILKTNKIAYYYYYYLKTIYKENTMDIKINRDILLSPLSNVSGIIEKKHTLPILSNLLIEGENGIIKFIATDLEMQISLAIKTEVKERFETTISARKLFDITRSLPEGSKLDFKIEESKVLVKAAKSRFNLQTLPAKDYPVMKKNEEESTSFSISQKIFKERLKEVDFSMAQQDIRYYLNGLLFDQYPLIKNSILDTVGNWY